MLGYLPSAAGKEIRGGGDVFPAGVEMDEVYRVVWLDTSVCRPQGNANVQQPRLAVPRGDVDGLKSAGSKFGTDLWLI